jgi:integrase
LECHKLAREVEKSATVRLGEKSPRLFAYLTRYIEGRTDIGESTRKLHALVIARLKRFFPADPKLDAIGPADAADFRKWCATHKFRPKDGDPYTLSEPSVGRHVTIAKLIFQQAEDEEVIGRNPFRKLKVAQVKSDKQWAYIDAQALDKIMEACPDDEHRAAFALARWAGLRLGEACRLKWAHIDWKAHTLTVVHEGKRTTKKRTRVVPIPANLYAILDAAYSRAADKSQGPCGELRRGNLYRRIDGIMERAQVAVYADPFHTLRRNCATDWVAKFSALDVAGWMGHDVRVMAEFYHKTTAETLAKATGTTAAQSEPEKVKKH